jgi:hypothetical protein
MAAPPFADRTRVCFFTRGLPDKRLCGTLMVQRQNSPPTWGVMPDDPPFYLDGAEVYNVTRANNQRPVVGSFWGGLAKIANPFSSPLSPIAQAGKVVNAFRGGGGSPPPPPAYNPYAAPPAYNPYAAPSPPPMAAPQPYPMPPPPMYPPPSPPQPQYAAPMYAPPTGLPGYDLSTQYASPAAQYDWSAFGAPSSGGWDAAYGPSP